MSNRLVAVALCGLFVVACTSSTEPSTTLGSTTTLATTTTTTAGEAASGRLVVIDDTGNVVVVDPDGSHASALTTDAAATTRYFQPTWSPDSSMIAWSVGRPQGSEIGIISADGSGPGTVEMSNFPFYVSWSPDGGSLGVLHNGAAGSIDFELVDVGGLTSEVIDSGAPFYFAWNPEGDGVLTHARGDTLAVLDPDGVLEPIGVASPNFSAPVWAPSGYFYLAGDSLVHRQDGESLALASADGFVSIVSNDQGTRLAVQVLNDDDDGGLEVAMQTVEELTPNAVSVVDVGSGNVEVASPDPSLGSFWSPDGERLLLLIPTGRAGGVEVRVWQAGETETVAAITLPIPLIGEVLQFFDQYAQSWLMWSPDSRSIVLPGTIDDESGIWVIPTGGNDPIRVIDGTWAAWSPS